MTHSIRGSKAPRFPSFAKGKGMAKAQTTATKSRRKPGKKQRMLAAVTGASAGIGESFARELAKRGWDLLLVARRKQRLEKLAAELRADHGCRVDILAADLTRPAALRRVEDALSASRRLGLLVNNAGMGDFGVFSKSDRDREESEIRLNTIAVVRLTHAALPGMVRRKSGSIINVSSTAGFAPCPNFATYGATKAFLNSFTEALHEELADSGVAVQALCPGLTHTEIFEAAGTDTSGLPEFLWMESEDVVIESLNALETGTVVCVPGLGNRALSTLARMLPHIVGSRFASIFGSQMKEK
ncbi:MAG: short-subunit dehydrogenase [Hyphomicrobiaceae bacterium]